MPVIGSYYKCTTSFIADNGLIIARKQKLVQIGERYRVIDVNNKEICLESHNGKLMMSLVFFLEHFQLDL